VPELIEWTGAGPQDIVWRYPDNRPTWGATLIVAENQLAVFFRDGKAYDVFGPGRHVLTTQNLPLLSKAYSKLRGFKKSEFTSEVIFVSTSQFQGKFGGRGQTQELAPLMFHGSYWFKVEEPKLFVVEVVGNSRSYTTDAVNEFIRGFIVEKIIDTLAGFTLRDVFTQLDESSMKVKTKIKEQFRRIGIDLVDLKFEGLDTTPEYREKLFWNRSGPGRTPSHPGNHQGRSCVTWKGRRSRSGGHRNGYNTTDASAASRTADDDDNVSEVRSTDSKQCAFLQQLRGATPRWRNLSEVQNEGTAREQILPKLRHTTISDTHPTLFFYVVRTLRLNFSPFGKRDSRKRHHSFFLFALLSGSKKEKKRGVYRSVRIGVVLPRLGGIAATVESTCQILG